MNHARRLSWSDHSVGMLAFLALFPGFFFYHSLLGLGMTGAFLGGFFAPVSLLVVGPLCFLYAYRVRREARHLTRVDVLFFIYVAYFLSVIGVNAAAGANAVIVGHHILAALFTLNLFLIFRLTDFARSDFRFLAFVSLIGMSAIVFIFSVDGAFYLAPLGTAKNPESLATYQGFSRSYLVTFLAVAPLCKKRWLRVLLYCLGTATLFVNTARSEFAAMLFVIPIIELYYSKNKLLMLAIFIFIFVFLLFSREWLLEVLPHNRILELLDLSHSSSANKRHHLTMYAMNTIGKFPVFGDYGSYNPGFYSHNVLSAWVDTGLFGFLFVLALLILPAMQMLVKGYVAQVKDEKFILAFSMVCITLLLLATAHYFTDMLIGATLGAYSTYRYGRKNATNRPPHLGSPAPRHPHLRQAMPQAGRPRV